MDNSTPTPNPTSQREAVRALMTQLMERSRHIGPLPNLEAVIELVEDAMREAFLTGAWSVYIRLPIDIAADLIVDDIDESIEQRVQARIEAAADRYAGMMDEAEREFDDFTAAMVQQLQARE